MKNFLKSFVICSVLALVGSMTTSCIPDGPEGGNDKWGTPVLEITGDAVAHTAVSVDVPVNGKYIKKLACLVKEIIVDENGTKYFVTGYDKENKPTTTAYAVPSANMVFRNGKAKEAGASFSNIHLDGNDGLDRNKTFEVFIAATISDTEYYNNGQVLSAMFTTPDRYADDDVAVIRQNYEGMDVYVTFPESVKAKGRRVKWGVTNIAMLEYNGNPPMPQLLHSCDYVYPAYLIERDTLLEINHYNAYRRNDKGEIGYYVIGNGYCTEVDPNSDDVKNGVAGIIQYYYNFQPGEPLVLLMSEVDYAECDCESPKSCGKKHPTIDWGWGKGWYWYPYDMEGYQNANWHDGLPSMGGGASSSTVDAEKYWHEGAWYRKVELRLPGPEKFESTVNVEFSNLTTKDGSITFTPEGETYMYLVGIFEHTNEFQQGYIDITRDYLDGDESLWQWFTTAEMAPYFGVYPYYAAEGQVKINLSEYFASLVAGTKYHVVVNALGKTKDKNGDYYADVTAQNFQHLTFQLKEYTLPEPELQVTAVEPYSSWKVSFNVKNPNWKTNPIESVSFVANYARDFASYMKANGFTYTDMAMMNAGIAGYQLNDADIEMVNSEAGANIEFDVLENSQFTAAFIGWNTEGRPSNPDSETYPGYATASSLVAVADEALDLTKLNALKGEWTASAKVKMYNAETGEFTLTDHSWKVTIGELSSPSSLSQDIYDIFERNGVSKAAADAYFAEFKEQEAAYNQSVTGLNRVLCTGWAVDGDRGMSTATPWDLFIMEDYNSSATSYLFHDFGPKWFLQVNKDGNIFIPVNYNRVAPLTSWYNGQAHYLCGANYDSKYAMLYDSSDPSSVESVGIDVAVSADGNTVVLQPYTVNFYEVDENGNPKVDDQGDIILSPVQFYPNVVYESTSGLAFYNSHVVSEVTLTRGWTAPSKASVKGNGHSGKKVVPSNVQYTAPKRPYSITTLVPQQPKAEVTVSKNKQVTPEQTRTGMEKLMKKLQPASLK